MFRETRSRSYQYSAYRTFIPIRYGIASFPSIEKPFRKRDFEISSTLVSEFNVAKRILILAGTLDKNPELQSLLSQFVKNHSVVVLTEANSNLYHDKFFQSY